MKTVVKTKLRRHVELPPISITPGPEKWKGQLRSPCEDEASEFAPLVSVYAEDSGCSLSSGSVDSFLNSAKLAALKQHTIRCPFH